MTITPVYNKYFPSRCATTETNPNITNGIIGNSFKYATIDRVKQRRFLYDANKYSVVIYNNKNLITQKEFYIGTETIPANDSYIHLGIECNSCL